MNSKDFQVTKDLIERCLNSYCTQEETILLVSRNGIKPEMTQIVWNYLAQQNEQFFKLYALLLRLKAQVEEFNKLAAIQAEAYKFRNPPPEIISPSMYPADQFSGAPVNNATENILDYFSDLGDLNFEFDDAMFRSS